MSCRVHNAWLALVLASAALAPRAAAQAAEPASAGAGEREYEQAIQQGLVEQRHGNYAEMYAAMQRAHRIAPNARTLRGLGVAAFELKDYVAALVHLRAALDAPQKALTAELRASVTDLIAQAESYVDTLEVALDPEAADLGVDGRPPVRDDQGRILLALGEHELTAKLDGHQPVSRSVRAVGGTTQRVSLKLAPLPPPAQAPAPAAQPTPESPRGSEHAAARDATDHDGSQRTWGYVALTGAGATAIGAGVAFALRESAAETYNSAQCAPLRSVQCADEADRVDTMETLSIIGLASTGALAITGVILLLTDESGAAAEHASPACIAGISSLTCHARF